MFVKALTACRLTMHAVKRGNGISHPLNQRTQGFYLCESQGRVGDSGSDARGLTSLGHREGTSARSAP